MDGVGWDFSQSLLPEEWGLFQELLEGAIRRVPMIENAEITKLINGPEAITMARICWGRFRASRVSGLRQ